MTSVEWLKSKTQQVVAWSRAHPLRTVLALFAVFAFIVYLPFVWHGGFEYDDWSASGLGRGCPGLVSSFRCFWPGYPDRPLASLYYSLDSNIFRNWPSGYIVADLAEWLGGCLLVFTVLRKRFGLNLAAPFLFIAAIPSISSTIIFSPAMQAIGSCAFLVWAAAFYFLDKHLQNQRRKTLYISMAFLLGSLLLYESSMPLFGLYALWPLITKTGRVNASYYNKYLKNYLLPVAGILLLIIAYQYLIVLHFFDYISKVRLSQIQHPVDFGLRVITNDLYILTVGLAGFGARGLLRLRHAGGWAILSVLFLSVVTGFGLVAGSRPIAAKLKPRTYGLFWLAIAIAVAGVALLHFIANLPPTLVGYNNRGEVANAIVLALVGALVWQRYLSKKPVWIVLGVLFFMAYLSTFILQRNNYVKANTTRHQIQASVIPQVEAAHHRDMVVIADVPEYTPTNFDDETIFSDEVLDWGIFLQAQSNVKNIQGISVSPGRITRGEISIHNGELRTMGNRDTPLILVWYYQAETGKLIKIQNPSQLKSILNQVNKHPAYNYILPADALNRAKLQEWLASY